MIDSGTTHHHMQHYEYNVEEKWTQQKSASKEKAFKSLKELQGWCTPFKASILMDIIYEAKPEIVVEIGVFGGSSLIPMAFALKDNGHGTIFGIDPWSTEESILGMTGENEEWWGSIDHDRIYDDLLKKIQQYKLEEQVNIIRASSEKAPPIPSIDVLHIDGNHSDATSYFDVTKWVPLVKEGGVIIFDDINWKTTKRAVEWLDSHCSKLIEYQEANQWGIWKKGARSLVTDAK